LSETLLATKLYIPSLHPQIIQRQPILDLMNDGLSIGKRLTLVCAPAGYGKTTLVCEWLQKIPRACWISLEKGDNDPRLFFSYLIAALRSILPEIGGQAQAILDAPQPPPLQVVLASLLNDLAQIHAQTVIVLDDYQSIHASQIHEGIAFLLDHLPPEVHFVITTRSDPALPLHRYRSRGQLVEIRAGDLRFTTDEVYAFMKDIADVSLSASEVATLESRTEGWAAGLQMAAISLRKKSNSSEFIQSLAGSNRYILDYLMEEVLKNQTPDVQHFLMETAILDRLCPPLCDALFQAGEVSSQQILQYLEHENLFVIPLDDEGYWYRYHHLFQDLLRMRLKQTIPERIQTLHRSAANWYEVNGWITETVQHYIQGADFERAADVVEQHTLQLFAQGKLDQLMGWIQKLPAGLSVEVPSGWEPPQLPDPLPENWNAYQLPHAGQPPCTDWPNRYNTASMQSEIIGGTAIVFAEKEGSRKLLPLTGIQSFQILGDLLRTTEPEHQGPLNASIQIFLVPQGATGRVSVYDGYGFSGRQCTLVFE